MYTDLFLIKKNTHKQTCWNYKPKILLSYLKNTIWLSCHLKIKRWLSVYITDIYKCFPTLKKEYVLMLETRKYRFSNIFFYVCVTQTTHRRVPYVNVFSTLIMLISHFTEVVLLTSVLWFTSTNLFMWLLAPSHEPDVRVKWASHISLCSISL